MKFLRAFLRPTTAPLLVLLTAGCAVTGAGVAPNVATPAAVDAVASNPAPAPSQTGAGAAGTAPAGATRPASANGTASAAPAAGQPAQGLRAFADVVKDATPADGLFRIWTKDDRTWIEVQPDQFGQLYFLSSSLNRGIGEARLYGGMMSYPAGLSHPIELRKIGNLVQVVARNVRYVAKDGTPEARAVAAGFSDSLLASAAVVSQPHPERKSVLIDASTIFLADLPGAAIFLERVFRQPYAFDARNSTLTRTRSTTTMATFEVSAHYALARPLRTPPGGASETRGAPSLPSTVPDPRSLFLGFHYTLTKLPAEPMRPRHADERIGYFTTERLDFTSDIPRVPVTRYVNRWRLERQDPSAPMSEPKQPIVFWLDRNIPEKYRAPIREGILEWNRAFERIGFKDAIRVEQQPDDAEFDTSDLAHASVRWLTAARTSFGAIGPTVVDPRTGEILDADIGIDANNVRVIRNLRSEYVPRAPGATAAGPAEDAPACEYDERATGEAVFGLSLLEARGELVPDSPDVERFVAAFLKDTTMHEVGHALGLRHNFRASTIYTDEELADPEFTKANGISGSVMEYNPWNIALAGARQGAYQMSTLGPYDYWAIEFGYREFTASGEAEGLAAIASRSSEPRLAFATDEDASILSLDPHNNQLDLGREPLSYAEKRFALVRELLERTEARELRPGESYAVLRRNFTRALGEASQAAVYAAKYIGGLTTLRDRAGSGREPLTPVAPEKQRAALQMIAWNVFAADSFRFSPAFLRRMAVSSFDIEDAAELGRKVPTVDVAVDQQVLAMQRLVLAQLMGEVVAQRLVNNEAKVDAPERALRLSELYATLHGAVWSELASGRDIALPRRNLQREYVVRIATALTQPAASMPADARALLRMDATKLRTELAKARDRAGLSEEAKAHLAESLALVEEALKAPLVRQAV